MRVLIAGGGTGGHIYPGIAIAERLIEKDVIVDFACTSRTIDRDILSCNEGIFSELIFQPITPIGLGPVRFLKFLYKFHRSQRIIEDYFRKYNDVIGVIGLGGFGSVAAIRIAYKKGIKSGILNPDFVAGKANKFCARYVDKVFVQWAETERYFRRGVEVTGVPLRKRICELREEGKRDEYRRIAIRRFGLSADKRVLVIVGGSSGAQSLNEAVKRVISEIFSEKAKFKDDWQIIHIVGKAYFKDSERKGYEIEGADIKIVDFCDEMELIWSVADLAICRAGAITLSELKISRVPAIFLPYPFHRDNHQRLNAMAFAERGAGIIVDDDGRAGERTCGMLRDAMLSCLGDVSRIERMKRNIAENDDDNYAAERIAEWITGK